MAVFLLQAIGAPAVETARFPAPEARQGVTAGSRFVYAIDNNTIAKYDPATGKRAARWKGNPRRFKHLNSCTLVERTLVCAGSNYPDLPMASSVETLTPDASAPRHAQPWRGARVSTLGRLARGKLVGLLRQLRRQGRRAGPRPPPDDDRALFTGLRRAAGVAVSQEVLRRMAPRSSSGGAWNADGLLYVTGHDAAEMYAERSARAGSWCPALELVAIVPTVTAGQAIDWDPEQPRTLWSIDRKASQIVASRIPVVHAGP